MTARIFIAIPCHGRAALSYECIKTVDDSRHSEDGCRALNSDILALYEDGENQIGFASGCADEIHRSALPVGIEHQRRRHFIDFWNRRERDELTHLYLTDADSPHDRAWRAHALTLQEKYRAPICLYRSPTHAGYHKNLYRDDPSEEVLWQRFSPGVSLLLTVEMVAKIMPHVEALTSWDWQVPSILGHKMAVARVSHCCHIGIGGQHDPADGSLGPEKSINPTPELAKLREEIIERLRSENAG